MYYPNDANKICSQCQNPCKTCSNNPLNCTSCNIGYYFSESNNFQVFGVCLFICPSGFYPKII